MFINHPFLHIKLEGEIITFHLHPHQGFKHLKWWRIACISSVIIHIFVNSLIKKIFYPAVEESQFLVKDIWIVQSKHHLLKHQYFFEFINNKVHFLNKFILLNGLIQNGLVHKVSCFNNCCDSEISYWGDKIKTIFISFVCKESKD